MRAADCVVDIGPGAGEHGGKLVEIGTAETLMQNPDSVTGKKNIDYKKSGGSIRCRVSGLRGGTGGGGGGGVGL